MADDDDPDEPADESAAWADLELGVAPGQGVGPQPGRPATGDLSRRDADELRNLLTQHEIDSREFILWALALGIALVLVGTGVLLALGTIKPQDAKELLPLALTPLFTLAGTALAFFFRTSEPK